VKGKLHHPFSKPSFNLLRFSFIKSAAGEVFVAQDSKLRQKVAIKKMALNDESVELLVTEISIMKSSTHPNIVTYYDTYVTGNEIWVSPSSPPLLPLLSLCHSQYGKGCDGVHGQWLSDGSS